MPVEIDENELARLRGGEKVLNELLGPKTGSRAHALIKEHHPEHKVPLDAEEIEKRASDKFKEMMEARDKTEKDARIQREFNATVDSYRLSEKNPDGFTEEGINAVLELMRERTIPDFHAGVLLFRDLHPKKSEPPSGYMPAGWNFGQVNKGDTDKELLFKDPDAWADQEARKVWEEHRRAIE